MLNFDRFVDNKLLTYQRVLKKYLPEEFVLMVSELLVQHPVHFKIVRPRKTKLGDFRSGLNGEKPTITVNGNLNPYSFLITTLHEFAHLQTFEKHGWKVPPHGKEWKNTYAHLLLPVIEKKALPEDIHNALTASLYNVKASSCSDQNLSRVLMRYDKSNSEHVILEELQKNSTFTLNGKTFLKGPRRRTRYVCTEKNSQKMYLVNALAQVKEVKHEQ